jgi:hypothetical protein
MKTLEFKTKIKASPKHIWQILWDDVTYREWTSTFAEGSHAKSDWKEGSEILFLGPSGEGMYSMIETKIPEKKMVFRHLGTLMDGKKTPGDWAGAKEEYTLESENGNTKLSVKVDIVEEHEEFFNQTFPVALQKVKEISEK